MVNRAVADEVARAVDEMDALDDIVVGVITGASGSFCDGADLKALAAGERSGIPGPGFCGVTETPPVKPPIADVEGYALGGDSELALACDLIVASREAYAELYEHALRVAQGLREQGIRPGAAVVPVNPTQPLSAVRQQPQDSGTVAVFTHPAVTAQPTAAADLPAVRRIVLIATSQAASTPTDATVPVSPQETPRTGRIYSTTPARWSTSTSARLDLPSQQNSWPT